MTKILLQMLAVTAIGASSHAGSPMNLDSTFSSMTSSKALHHASGSIFQGGQIVSKAQVDPTRTFCTFSYSHVYDPNRPAHLLSVVSSSLHRNVSYVDSWNFSDIQVRGFETATSTVPSTAFFCEKRFDSSKPAYIDTTEIATAFGKYAKFTFKFLSRQATFLGFASLDRPIKVTFHRNFTLSKKAVGYSGPTLVFDGKLKVDADYKEEYNLTEQNFDVVQLSLEDGYGTAPISFQIGDELILNNLNAFTTQYSLIPPESFETGMMAFMPRLNRWISFTYMRAKDSRHGQGSISDIQRAVGNILTIY